nr:hypothetical protein [Microvirga tunisiensis]
MLSARPAEPAIGGGQHVLADLVAITQENEEGQERQEGMKKARNQGAAEGFRPFGQGLAVDAVQKLLGRLRRPQMRLPPGVEMLADERQAMDPFRHGHAVLLQPRQPLHDELAFAADLGQRKSDRHEKENGKTDCHKQGGGDARAPQASLDPAIKRPDADGDNPRPAEGGEIGADHPESEPQEHGRADQARHPPATGIGGITVGLLGKRGRGFFGHGRNLGSA